MFAAQRREYQYREAQSCLLLNPDGLIMRIFFLRRVSYLYMPLKPQHNSPVSSVLLHVRGGHLTGVTEVACWLLIHDSLFSMSWECKQPLGDRFNHVFIFSNFHFLEGFFSVSPPALKPQRYISLHTQTSFFWFPVGRSWARPPRLSVTFRVFQKCLCLFMCRNKISCRPTQSLVGGSETQEMYYFTYSRAMIKICQGLEGIWKYSDFHPGV